MAAGEIVLIVLIFSAQAGWPPPDPNEAHYLGKARHYWNPGWVPGDFFFDSADTHLVFYATLGWLSRWMPLECFAWCGRLLTWALLAWTWRRLSWALVPKPAWAVLSAAVFLVLNVGCHMAGEWVVGGFEAKGLAYALVFVALEALVRGRWRAVWLWLGAASALHVLVGGWSTIAAAACWLASGSDRPSLRSMLPALAGGLLLASAGLGPALALNWGVEPQVVAQANEIYVFERLSHHLVIWKFTPWFVARHAALLLAWLLLYRIAPIDDRLRRLSWFVMGAVAIMLAGTAICLLGWNRPEAVAGWLRFYWFRLSDSMLPVGVALVGMAQVARLRPPRVGVAGWLLACIVLAAIGWRDYSIGHVLEPVPRADKPGKVIDHRDWRAACLWAGDHTPPDARFLTPRMAQTFKWHAGRAEVVTWKDIPQDARAIVEWRRRLVDIHGTSLADRSARWHDSLTELSASELRRLGQCYQADYLLTEAAPRLALKRIYQNNSYAIYRLRESQ